MEIDRKEAPTETKKRSKAHALDLSRFNDSGSTGIRTPDPLLVRQML